MNHITIKFSSLPTIKREECKFIVNCFFENNQNGNEQNETFSIPNVTMDASIANESQTDAVVFAHELSNVLNETIDTNIITAPTLTENITINNREQCSPTIENNNSNINKQFTSTRTNK